MGNSDSGYAPGQNRSDTVLIACGALAREITALIRVNNWQHMKVQCLPAKLHNTPNEIAPAVQSKITELRDAGYNNLYVAYADCGTGGELDRVLEKENVERIGGPHCYSFFAGAEVFDALHESEFGTFYLTDFLVRHFDRLILRDMGIEKHPELLPMYFGNYKKLVYLAQTEIPELVEQARAAADKLGLEFEHHITGYGELEVSLEQVAQHTEVPVKWHV
ncbi:MAG: DUF1638 domain-containing protein [Pseudomonadota bacterium]